MQGGHEHIWICPKEAARLLESSPWYIYQHYRDAGWPRFIRIGQHIKFRRVEFLQWLETRLGRK
jgi:predicted DNA-binding transcriptional regulator AlpA